METTDSSDPASWNLANPTDGSKRKESQNSTGEVSTCEREDGIMQLAIRGKKCGCTNR